MIEGAKGRSSIKAASTRGRNASMRGKAFERRVAKWLSKVTGFDWRRTPLSGGWTKKRQEHLGDVYPVGREKLATQVIVECKNRASWSVEQLFTGTGDLWLWMQGLEQGPGKLNLLFLTKPGGAFVLIGVNCMGIQRYSKFLGLASENSAPVPYLQVGGSWLFFSAGKVPTGEMQALFRNLFKVLRLT